MQRYFGLKNNDKLTIEEDDIFHIKKVMRMKENEQFEIVADNKVYLCNITSLEPFSFNIIEEKEEVTELKHQITIGQGIVKEQKMDYILQKCTELGMATFIPLQLERCMVKIDAKEEKKLQRWSRICKEASEQSFRTSIPDILKPMTLKQLVELDYDVKLVCSTKKNIKSIKKVLQSIPSCVRILFVIGPEGGISPKEEEFLEENGFILTSLGNRILRTETAPLFALSACIYEEM